MFKISLFVIFCWLCCAPDVSAAAGEGAAVEQSVKSESGSRLGKGLRTFTRGIVNIISLPFEIPRTIVEERKKRPNGWLLMILPRTLENVMARGVSAVHDSLIYPFYVSGDEEEVPWSRRFDIPDYPWQLRYEKEMGHETEDTSNAQFFGIRG